MFHFSFESEKKLLEKLFITRADCELTPITSRNLPEIKKRWASLAEIYHDFSNIQEEDTYDENFKFYELTKPEDPKNIFAGNKTLVITWQDKSSGRFRGQEIFKHKDNDGYTAVAIFK